MANRSAEGDAPLAVVVVTFNSSSVVLECLDSLRAGVSDADVVVVDNASTDGTVALVQRCAPWVRVLERRVNGGFAAGVNAGFEVVGPEADVLVLNPDIRLQPGAVATLRAGGSAAGILVPTLVDADGRVSPSLRREPRAGRSLLEAVLGGRVAARLGVGEHIAPGNRYLAGGVVDWATGAAWLIRPACRAAIGPMDERYFLYSEETEYMLRAGDAGFPVVHLPAASVVHLGGEQGTSPWLWSMSVTNRVRLQRERHGRVAAVAMRCAALLNEAVRAVTRPRDARYRVALRDLLRMPYWAPPPGTSPAPDYVCFSAQDWWYHNQAHSDFQLMRALAADHRVLVVNSIGMRMPTPGRSRHVLRKVARKARSVAKFVRRPLPGVSGFVVMSPLPLPFYGSPALRRVNAVLVRAQVRVVARLLGMRRPTIVVTIPTAWDVVRDLPRKALVFNRSDRHAAFPEADSALIEELEQQLLQRSDHVLYVSRSLMAEERPLTGDRAHFLDHGVDVDHFRLRAANELPADLAAIPGPRVGFFGALDEFVVDFELLDHLAAELPDVSIVLVGSADGPVDALVRRHSNVHWLGSRPYPEIPNYGSGFDVAIMPWRDSPWIRHCNPIKLKEYLALGLPVVSTEYDEIDGYRDRVRVAGDRDAFVAAVRDSLREGALQEPEALRASVQGHSWTVRSAELARLVTTTAS